MQRLQFIRIACAAALAVAAAIAMAVLVDAATPANGTLSTTSGPLAWDGPSTGGTSPDGEATCIEGTTCDTYTLTIAPGDYTGKRVRFKVTWTVPTDDYDVYVHQGSKAGPIVQSSTGGAPSTAEENTFDLNRVGLIKSGTSLIGLRGQATADRLTVAGLVSVGFSDSTRGGGAFTIGSCQQ